MTHRQELSQHRQHTLLFGTFFPILPISARQPASWFCNRDIWYLREKYFEMLYNELFDGEKAPSESERSGCLLTLMWLGLEQGWW